MPSYNRTMEAGYSYDVCHGIDHRGSIIETSTGSAIFGRDGKKRAAAKITYGDLREYQPDPSRPSDTVGTLTVIGFLPAGRYEDTMIVPLQELLTDSDGIFKKSLRAGVEWDNTGGELLTLVLLASDPKTAHRCPVRTNENTVTPGGIEHNGMLVANAPLEVLSTSDNELGYPVYQMRVARDDGSGFDYFEVPTGDFFGTLPQTVTVGDRQIRGCMTR